PLRFARLPQYREHRVVDPSVARHDRRCVQVERPARHVRDAATRLLDEEAAGGGVPRTEPQLPEAVEPPRRHPREVEDGGPERPGADPRSWGRGGSPGKAVASRPTRSSSARASISVTRSIDVSLNAMRCEVRN